MKLPAIIGLLLLVLIRTNTNVAFAKKTTNSKKAYRNLSLVSNNDKETLCKDHNNSIQFSATKMFFPDHNNISIIKKDFFTVMNMGQLGVYFEKKIYRNWRIMAGVSEWNETSFLSEHKGIAGVRGYEPIDKVGSIITRWSYKMVDVFAMYRYNKFKKHKIKTGLGLSYTRGANDFVDSVYLNPGGGDGILYLHYEKHSYLGVIPCISYDYMFFRNRFAFGWDLRLRKYFGIHSSQIDYGYHLSLNF